ncbi:MAG: hypothetical protein OSA89_15440 [Mariniblastus sp.]|nr:hypothetical protein [Mariniblastus sp.]
MLIEIQCVNYSSFDASVGKYIECGEKIIVSGEKAGETIECTKCNQVIEIPLPGETQAKSRANRPEDAHVAKAVGPSSSKVKTIDQRSDEQRRAQQPRRAGQPRRRAAGTEVSPEESQRTGSLNAKGQPRVAQTRARVKSSNGRRVADGSASVKSKGKRLNKVESTGKGTPKPSSDPDRRVRRRRRKATDSVSGQGDIMALDFKSQDVAQNLVEDQQERCKKCGNLVENARCVVCFFVDSKYEKLHCPLPDIEIQVAGCQRWLKQTMSEGVSIEFIALAGHLLFGAMAMILSVISILFLSGLGLGVAAGIVLLSLTIASTCFYAALVFKSYQFLRKPAAQLAWFQKPFWRLLLFTSRLMKWEGYDNALKGRRVICVRDRMFGDHDIMEHKGIKNAQVLDIQGTNLTDHGLLNLYELKHLQCVVLVGTKVSSEAVFRFQQTFPRLWIWY